MNKLSIKNNFKFLIKFIYELNLCKKLTKEHANVLSRGA